MWGKTNLNGTVFHLNSLLWEFQETLERYLQTQDRAIKEERRARLLAIRDELSDFLHREPVRKDLRELLGRVGGDQRQAIMDTLQGGDLFKEIPLVEFIKIEAQLLGQPKKRALRLFVEAVVRLLKRRGKGRQHDRDRSGGKGRFWARSAVGNKEPPRGA